MRRREFIGLVGSAAAAWPMLAQAQNTNKAPRRIAFFPDLNPVVLEYWQADMRVLGWINGQDFIILPSGIEYGSRNPSNEDAQRVVANKPDLIFTMATNYALAAQRATGSIPIVMLTSGYPVEAGVANSLARPGRNVTGNTIYAETAVWGKLLQLLSEAKPPNSTIPSAARLLNLELHIVEVTNSDQVQAALAEIKERNPEGLLLTSFFALKSRPVVTQFALDKGLPTIVDADWTRIAPPHPLLCYGPIFRELVQTAVASVDKILRGSRPGDLPIQRPSRFELVVSLRTAKAIGLDLPLSLLARADRVIE